MLKRLLNSLFLCLLNISAFSIFFLSPNFSQAAQVSLAWDSVSPAPDNYTLYYRTGTQSYDYSQPVWKGSQTNTLISNLEENKQLCFVVRANVGNLESNNSNEICTVLSDTTDSGSDGLSVGNEVNAGTDTLDFPDVNQTSRTIYEDAEDGTIDGWDVYDNSPSGASIRNVYDQDRQSSVIDLAGSGKSNGYRLRNDDGSRWKNSTQFVIQWSMKYSELFYIYIDLKTTAGHRYLVYEPTDSNTMGANEYIHYGIGSHAMNGQWHTFVRDLQADVQTAQPGVKILEVNGFLIRGSGKIDAIKLLTSIGTTYEDGEGATTYENAEDGRIDGWDVYDDTPSGASISNVYDQARKSSVIEFVSSGTNNGFRLRNEDGSRWQNNTQFVIQWSMKSSSSCQIYIDLKTTGGHKYLVYTPVDRDVLGGGEYIEYGIGSDAINGQWHTFVRDLQADVQGAQPNVEILEVNGFLIRGSGKVDDIELGK